MIHHLSECCRLGEEDSLDEKQSIEMIDVSWDSRMIKGSRLETSKIDSTALLSYSARALLLSRDA
jgi:hypothetical protein